MAIDDDIDLHPKNKRLPASRLGWAAANLVYGQDDKPLEAPRWDSILTHGVNLLKCNCQLRYTMLQTNVTIEFKADVKLEAMEDDRFMVCCLENRNDCSQVIGIRGMTRTEWLVFRCPMEKDGWV